MITYGITVCNETYEFKRCIDGIYPFLLEDEDILVLADKNKVTQEIIEYCNYLNIRYELFEFNNNFAEFKNRLLELIETEYLFQIDADEQIPTSLIHSVRSILKNHENVDGLHIPRINLVNYLTKEDVIKFKWEVNKKGWINYPDYQFRVIKKKDGIKWGGSVHEQVFGAIKQLAIPSEKIDQAETFSIIHVKDVEKQRSQNSLYEEIELNPIFLPGFRKLVIPYKTKYTKKRYGAEGDSGYIYLEEPFNKSDIVYSYGLDSAVEDISFDLACSDLNKQVFMYDASIEKPAENRKEFTFKKEFLTAENFSIHIKENDHENETNMILKMDIEGSEYDCIYKNIDLVEKHFSQISIEVHNVHQYEKTKAQQDFWREILKRYNIYHIHGNAYESMQDGIPDCLEISFLRKDFEIGEKEDRTYPIEGLDFCNVADGPDFKIGWWLNKCIR
jgi:hypothetical protein